MNEYMYIYSVIKKNDILPFATALMDLEGILVNEVSQTEKENNIYVGKDLTYMGNLRKTGS